MNSNNVAKLKKKFPRLLKQIDNIWCGDGWFGVVYGACNDCLIKFPKIQFVEVKEKFGRLIIIPKSGTYPEIRKEELWGLLEAHSNLSTTVCEETSGIGFLHVRGGNLKALCPLSAILLGYAKVSFENPELLSQ